MASQKDVFLGGEGDAWFARNRDATSRPDYLDNDPVIAATREAAVMLVDKGDAPTSRFRVLEIGCSDGRRLERLRNVHGFDVAGVEPSGEAVADAKGRGLDVKVGTADRLDHTDGAFDLVIFGFCLYLCDAADLFRIAAEADRVVRSPGWIVINDFYSTTPTELPYRHFEGVLSRKMDYRTLFAWHPAYTCYSHRIGRHKTQAFDDDSNEWVATSVMRKRKL